MQRSLIPPSSTARQTRLSVLRSFRRSPLQPTLARTDPPSGALERDSLSAWLAIAAVGFFIVAVVRRGWISDDAFITMRAVDHLFDGRGFVYNADERVLGFTNPLWAMLLVVPYLFVRDPYFAPIVGAIIVSALFAIVLVYRGSRDLRTGALILVALCFSRGFVDFSTSGLENPLTHLLLALFVIEYLRQADFSMLRLTACAALLLVNRSDTLPLLLPPLVSAYRKRLPLGDRRAIWLGWLPAVLWYGFAVVYYGFPFPNTAYAKLNAEIPKLEMIRQGASYFVDALVQDPQSIVIIATALVTLAVQGRKHEPAKTLLVALALELGYVAYIGGDFMSGRFLTPALAVSAVGLAHFWQPHFAAEPARLRSAALALGALILCFAFSPLRDDPMREKRDFPVTRIVNERAWFQDHLALLVNFRPVQWKAYGLYADGRAAREKHRRVVQYNNVGMFAWGAGPEMHIVDDLALTDPLLARIPFEYREDWRTGHLPRPIPEGYMETLESGKNVIRDPCIAHYYDSLNAIVRGPLFTAERWAAIIALNLPGGMTVKACPDRIPSLQAPVQVIQQRQAPEQMPPANAEQGISAPAGPAASP